MIIKEKISLGLFNPLFIKVVVDIEQEIISAGGELHSDCMEELLNSGSSPKDLWGANIYPTDKKIDFVSLINIRPLDNNRSMDIGNTVIKERIEAIIKKLLF